MGKLNKPERVFKKEYSKSLKGLLIILMFWSHMFNHPERINGNLWFSIISIFDNKIEIILCPFFHIAVPAFFFISGYGFYICDVGFKALLNKIKNIYFKYWLVFIVVIPLCIFNRYIIFDSKEFIQNFLGVSSSYCEEWWFLSTYIEINICFYLFLNFKKWLYKNPIKNNYKSFMFMCTFTLLVATAGYLMKYLLQDSLYSIELNSKNIFLKELYFVLIKQPLFCSGYIVAKYNVFEKLNLIINSLIFKIIIIAIVLIIPYVYGNVPETYVYFFYTPLFIFVFCELFKKKQILFYVLTHIGNYSMYMWLIHSILLYRFMTNIIFFLKYSVLCWLVLIVITYFCAIAFTFIENTIRKLKNKKNYV